MKLVDLIVNHDFPKFRALGTLDSQVDNLIESDSVAEPFDFGAAPDLAPAPT